jgi:hypothetical protein
MNDRRIPDRCRCGIPNPMQLPEGCEVTQRSPGNPQLTGRQKPSPVRRDVPSACRRVRANGKDVGAMSRVPLLGVGPFIVGTAACVMAGLVPRIGGELGTSVARTGQVITSFTLSYALAAPVLATLLVAAPAVFTVAAMVPPQRRGRAPGIVLGPGAGRRQRKPPGRLAARPDRPARTAVRAAHGGARRGRRPRVVGRRGPVPRPAAAVRTGRGRPGLRGPAAAPAARGRRRQRRLGRAEQSRDLPRQCRGSRTGQHRPLRDSPYI